MNISERPYNYLLYAIEKDCIDLYCIYSRRAVYSVNKLLSFIKNELNYFHSLKKGECSRKRINKNIKNIIELNRIY